MRWILLDIPSSARRTSDKDLALSSQINNSKMLALTVVPLLLIGAASVFGTPAIKTGCDISQAKISFPANETAISAPTSAPSFIGLAIGTQNYSCSPAGTYT